MVKSKSARILAATALSLAVAFGASGCAPSQTTIPYNPAEGVNYDAPRADGKNSLGETTSVVPVKLRNMMVIQQNKGEGIISGAVLAAEGDQLTKIEGVPNTAKGTPGAPFNAASNVAIKPNEMVILTNGQPIKVTSADLTPGFTAKLKLTFAKAGLVEVEVPVVDGKKADYKDLKVGGGEASPAGSAAPAAPGAPATPAAQ